MEAEKPRIGLEQGVGCITGLSAKTAGEPILDTFLRIGVKGFR